MTDPDWLPPDFDHPVRLDLVTGHHLRPIRAADVVLDYPAVMGSRERLWEIYGEAWGWPPATMTYEQDEVDLAHHEEEIALHQSFNYAVLDAGETALFGCVYIDPVREDPSAALVSWWVVDDMVGTHLEQVLDDAIPVWLQSAWPFERVRYGV